MILVKVEVLDGDKIKTILGILIGENYFDRILDR